MLRMKSLTIEFNSNVLWSISIHNNSTAHCSWHKYMYCPVVRWYHTWRTYIREELCRLRRSVLFWNAADDAITTGIYYLCKSFQTTFLFLLDPSALILWCHIEGNYTGRFGLFDLHLLEQSHVLLWWLSLYLILITGVTTVTGLSSWWTTQCYLDPTQHLDPIHVFLYWTIPIVLLSGHKKKSTTTNLPWSTRP